MSAIASFIRLPKASLDEFRQATAQGGYDRFLRQHGEKAADYQWSGFVLATLLPYLEERHQVRLMKSEHDALATFLTQNRRATHFIFTDAHRHAYLDRLAPESFSESELCAYYNEFSASGESEAGRPMLDEISSVAAKSDRTGRGLSDCFQHRVASCRMHKA